MLRLIKAAGAAVMVLAVLLVSTAQQGPSPQAIPVFGISPSSLALDGIYAYPAGSGARITREQAQTFARGKQLREDKIKGAMLINLKIPADNFNGLAWVIWWDVDGQIASWPGDSQLPPGTQYAYTFSLTFVDATTGREITTLQESVLVEQGKPLPGPLEP